MVVCALVWGLRDGAEGLVWNRRVGRLRNQLQGYLSVGGAPEMFGLVCLLRLLTAGNIS
jgi:hypothetical protein